jgi:hypothetical protein
MVLFGQTHRRYVAGRSALHLAGDEAGLSELAQDGDTVRGGQRGEVQQPLVDGYRLLAGSLPSRS